MKKFLHVFLAVSILLGSAGIVRAAESPDDGRERIPSVSEMRNFRDIIKRGIHLFGVRIPIDYTAEARIVGQSGTNLEAILEHTGKTRNVTAQSDAIRIHTDPLLKAIGKAQLSQRYSINNFIVYGTRSTAAQTSFERAAAVKGYVEKNKKIPSMVADWSALIKEANQRTALKICKENDETCFKREIAACRRAAVTSSIGELAYYSEIKGYERNMCRVIAKFLKHPIQGWAGKEMSCLYDPLKDLDAQLKNPMGKCDGPLIDLMSKGTATAPTVITH